MQYTYNRKLKRWVKDGRIVSKASVPQNQTFYYNVKIKRFYDIEKGRIISKDEAMKRIYDMGGNVKIWRKSKNGNFYKDNQKVKELKRKKFTDKKPDVKKYKNTKIITHDTDISEYFKVAKEDENFIVIDFDNLVPLLYDFYKFNSNSEYNNERLYVFLEVEQIKEEGIYKQELGTQQLTENNINKNKIDKMLEKILEDWVFIYERSQTYGAKILNIKANAVFKQWKTF